jgi:hypothetical protein
MSIAAFYRNWLPFVITYGTFVEGDFVTVVTPPVFVKGNIQPFKSGTLLTLSEVGIAFKNYRTLYLRNLPPMPELPEGASTVKAYVWLEGNTIIGAPKGWYVVTSSKDYTLAGRAPKHYEMTALFSASDQPPDTGEPTPLPSLVDEFESIVSELHILTPIVLEVLT